MKRFFVLLFLIFPCGVHADTMNLNWIVDGQTYAQTTCTVGGNLTLPTAPTKYGYTFQGWAPFTPIEYLQSSGNGCIIVDYYANPNTKVFADYQLTSTSMNQTIFGTRVNSNGNNLCFCAMGSGQGVFAECSFVNTASSLHASNTPIDTNRHQVLISGQNHVEYWTGVTFGTASPYNATKNSTNKMSIFADSSCANRAAMKLYSLTIWDNDVIIYDFVPVIDGNNVPCLYEKVNKQYFYNSINGDFLAGPTL